MTQVYLSEYARLGLEAMEQDRPRMCLEYSEYIRDLELFIDGADPETLAPRFDYEGMAQNPETLDNMYMVHCGFEWIQFYLPATKEACISEEVKDFPLCVGLDSFLNEKDSPFGNYFFEDLGAFLNQEVILPWETFFDPEPVMSDQIGYLGAKKGNLLFGMRVPFLELEKGGPELKKFEAEDYLYFSSLTLKLRNKIFVPFLSIILSPIGVSDSSFNVRIHFVFNEKDGIRKELLQEPFTLDWNHPVTHDYVLTRDLLEKLIEADQIEIEGYYPEDEEGKNIFLMIIENKGFSEVLDYYIDQFGLSFPEAPKEVT